MHTQRTCNKNKHEVIYYYCCYNLSSVTILLLTATSVPYTDKIYTVEPLIMDPPNKGHDRNNLSMQDTSLGLKYALSHNTTNTLQPPKRGQPPYKGQNGWFHVSFIQRFPCIYYTVIPFSGG